MKKKKKYYIKKGPVFILILIIAALVASIVLLTKKPDKKDDETASSNTSTNQTSDTTSSGIMTDTSQTTQESTDETSIEQTPPASETHEDNAIDAFKSLSYYDDSLTQRYIAYKKANEDLSYEQAILYVNIGLDNAFYTQTKVISDPSSITALVNKYNSLGDYTPSDLVCISSSNSTKELYLRKEACEAFEKMCNDARSQGYEIKAMSTYRSYSRQSDLYSAYAAQDGAQEADTYSARAGFSEHQTGLVADVQGGDTPYNQFKKTKESSWVNENAYKYGFIVRYPEGKENITGYMAEAWHLRYVGVDAATIVFNEGITFDEYCAKYLI